MGEWSNQGELMASQDTSCMVIEAQNLVASLRDFDVAGNTCRIYAWTLVRILRTQDWPSDVLEEDESLMPTMEQIDQTVKASCEQRDPRRVKPTPPRANAMRMKKHA